MTSGEVSGEVSGGKCREKRRSVELQRRQGMGRRPWSRRNEIYGCIKKDNQNCKKILKEHGSKLQVKNVWSSRYMELGGGQWSRLVRIGLVEVRDEFRSVREFRCR